MKKGLIQCNAIILCNSARESEGDTKKERESEERKNVTKLNKSSYYRALAIYLFVFYVHSDVTGH